MVFHHQGLERRDEAILLLPLSITSPFPQCSSVIPSHLHHDYDQENPKLGVPIPSHLENPRMQQIENAKICNMYVYRVQPTVHRGQQHPRFVWLPLSIGVIAYGSGSVNHH